MAILQTNIAGRISELLFFPKDCFGIVNEGPGWSGVPKNLPTGSILAT